MVPETSTAILVLLRAFRAILKDDQETMWSHGLVCAKQVPYPLYFLSGPHKRFLLRAGDMAQQKSAYLGVYSPGLIPASMYEHTHTQNHTYFFLFEEGVYIFWYHLHASIQSLPPGCSLSSP